MKINYNGGIYLFQLIYTLLIRCLVFVIISSFLYGIVKYIFYKRCWTNYGLDDDMLLVYKFPFKTYIVPKNEENSYYEFLNERKDENGIINREEVWERLNSLKNISLLSYIIVISITNLISLIWFYSSNNFITVIGDIITVIAFITIPSFKFTKKMRCLNKLNYIHIAYGVFLILMIIDFHKIEVLFFNILSIVFLIIFFKAIIDKKCGVYTKDNTNIWTIFYKLDYNNDIDQSVDNFKEYVEEEKLNKEAWIKESELTKKNQLFKFSNVDKKLQDDSDINDYIVISIINSRIVIGMSFVLLLGIIILFSYLYSVSATSTDADYILNGLKELMFSFDKLLEMFSISLQIVAAILFGDSVLSEGLNSILIKKNQECKKKSEEKDTIGKQKERLKIAYKNIIALIYVIFGFIFAMFGNLSPNIEYRVLAIIPIFIMIVILYKITLFAIMKRVRKDIAIISKAGDK